MSWDIHGAMVLAMAALTLFLLKQSPSTGRLLLSGSLLPPAFGGCIFKHGIKMIHTYEPERFHLSIYKGAECAASSAYGAISDHYRCITNGIHYLVMITYNLNRIGFRFSIDYNPNYKFILVGSINCSSYK